MEVDWQAGSSQPRTQRGNRSSNQARGTQGRNGRWQHDKAGWQDGQSGSRGGRGRGGQQRGTSQGGRGGGRGQSPQQRGGGAFQIRGQSSDRGRGQTHQRQQDQEPSRSAYPQTQGQNQMRGAAGRGRGGSAHGSQGGRSFQVRGGQPNSNSSQNQNPTRGNFNQSRGSQNIRGRGGQQQTQRGKKQQRGNHSQQQQHQQGNHQSAEAVAAVAGDSPFATALAQSSARERRHLSSFAHSDDLIDISYAKKAANFINSPPGRVLNDYEIGTCVTLVFGFEEGKLYSQQEWFAGKAQDLALTVLTAKNCTFSDFSALQRARGRANYMLETERLDSFLAGINGFIQQDNPSELRNWLAVDPPFNDDYTAISVRLKNLPSGFNLLDHCRNAITEIYKKEWSSLLPFIHQYLLFLRDLDSSNLLAAYDLLKDLLGKANIALQHNTCGHLILPTVIKYSQLLSQFAIRLDKQPELIAHLPRSIGEEPSESLPERTANIIRQAFVTCLNDRSDPHNTAEYSRKFGIYTLANTCLKILFNCKKTGSAEQIFTNVYNQAPPLSLYPRSEQVTYLYYLGRFFWTTGHWYRAQLALQFAYDNSYRFCQKQRRIILVYLIASNMILGRFPSKSLYARPEAEGFLERFHPLCQCIARGDLETFYRLTDMKGPHAKWFLCYRILLQIRNRCEVLVWRTLARRAFQLCGRTPSVESRSAPTLALQDFRTIYTVLQLRARLPLELTSQIPADQTCDEWMMEDTFYPYMQMNVHISFQHDPDLDWTIKLPSMLDIESIFSSLIGQNLLGGFVSHRQLRFAIQGARNKGALLAGFPNVWTVTTDGEDEDVPGWKKDGPAQDESGGGRVIHLTDARPVGVAP